MSRSDAYLDNFSYNRTNYILDRNKRLRLAEKKAQYKYAYRKAKINRKARLYSFVLATGLTVTMAVGAMNNYFATAKSEVVHNSTKATEYATEKTPLSSRPIEEIHKEVIAHKEKNSNHKSTSKKEVKTTNETNPKEVKKSDIKIGGNGSEEVDKFLNEEYSKQYMDEPAESLNDSEENAGIFIYKYSADYGVDPSIIGAICYQESSLNHYENCPGGDSYNGYGVGLMQHESPSGEVVTAYNYNTEEKETDYITMDKACSVNYNIKLGTMEWQNSLEHYKGNPLLTIQSHNFGQIMTDKVLRQNYMKLDNLKKDYPDIVNTIKENNPNIYQFLSKNYPTTYGGLQVDYPETYETLWKQSSEGWEIIKDMIFKDYSNTSWLTWMKDAYNNPSKYLSNWQFEHYGDQYYVEHVLSHCPTKEISYKYDGNDIKFDLNTMSVISIENTKQNVR